jgi:hypothetical protein
MQQLGRGAQRRGNSCRGVACHSFYFHYFPLLPVSYSSFFRTFDCADSAAFAVVVCDFVFVFVKYNSVYGAGVKQNRTRCIYLYLFTGFSFSSLRYPIYYMPHCQAGEICIFLLIFALLFFISAIATS